LTWLRSWFIEINQIFSCQNDLHKDKVYDKFIFSGFLLPWCRFSRQLATQKITCELMYFVPIMKFKVPMFSKFKHIFIKIEHVLLVVLVIFSASFMYKAKDAKAITQATIVGSCGIIANTNINGWEFLMNAHQPASFTKNAIGTLNFDAGTYGIKSTSVNAYGNTNSVIESTKNSIGTLTLTGFEADTGLYQYTALDTTTNASTYFDLLPINSGNAFLISGHYMVGPGGTLRGPMASGVCQKI
jgi:hypothetical protein